MMKAALLVGPRRIQVREVPVPRLKRGELLVRIRAVGICRSDVHYYRTGRIGDQVIRKWPQLLGHEAAGEVWHVPPGVRGIHPGDRVAIEPAESCGTCIHCRNGRANICPRVKFLGMPGNPGAFAEFLAVGAGNLAKLPPRATFEEGVALEPMAIGLHAVRLAESGRDLSSPGSESRWRAFVRLSPSSGLRHPRSLRDLAPSGRVRLFGGPIQEAAVVGSGPVGLSVVSALRAESGARVTAFDSLPYRLRVARVMGAVAQVRVNRRLPVSNTARRVARKWACVFEAGGTEDAVELALEIASPGGVVALIGIHEGARTPVNLHLARRKELVLLNVRRSNYELAECVRMVASGKLDLSPMISHRGGLEDTGRFFLLAEGYRNGMIKAVINP